MTTKSSEIVILGNGKSLELYDEANHKDAIIIGCNVPPENIHIDFVCAVDAFAVSRAYRSNMPYHHRLKEGWKLVLGPRACGGIGGMKSVPGGKESLLEFLDKEGHIHKKMSLFDEAKVIGQRYFSTGHLAFMFACSDYPNAKIHLYGFDSFFTGSAASHSQSLLKAGKDLQERAPSNVSADKPDATVNSWFWLWEKLFSSESNNSCAINIHGYESDRSLEKIHDKIVVFKHKKVIDEVFQEK